METQQIKETIEMISEENLDIRTITMGISLLDCVTVIYKQPLIMFTLRL